MPVDIPAGFEPNVNAMPPDCVVPEVALKVIQDWSAETVNGRGASVESLIMTLCAVAAPPACTEKDSEDGFVTMEFWGLAGFPVPPRPTVIVLLLARVNVRVLEYVWAAVGAKVMETVRDSPRYRVMGKEGPETLNWESDVEMPTMLIRLCDAFVSTTV